MTTVQPEHRQAHPGSTPAPDRQERLAYRRPGTLAGAIFKAGWIGGINLALLVQLSVLEPLDTGLTIALTALIVIGFLVVSLGSGALAGILASGSLQTGGQAGRVGWSAGFWAGILAGLMAMWLAANNRMLTQTGQEIANLLSTVPGAYLAAWNVALIGRVLGALVVYGLLGGLLTAIFGALGAMISFWLQRGS